MYIRPIVDSDQFNILKIMFNIFLIRCINNTMTVEWLKIDFSLFEALQLYYR